MVQLSWALINCHAYHIRHLPQIPFFSRVHAFSPPSSSSLKNPHTLPPSLFGLNPELQKWNLQARWIFFCLLRIFKLLAFYVVLGKVWDASLLKEAKQSCFKSQIYQYIGVQFVFTTSKRWCFLLKKPTMSNSAPSFLPILRNKNRRKPSKNPNHPKDLNSVLWKPKHFQQKNKGNPRNFYLVVWILCIQDLCQ